MKIGHLHALFGHSGAKPGVLVKARSKPEVGSTLMFTGSATGKLFGITETTSAAKHRIKPSDFPEYYVFVQSTSYNRNLMGGTKFLYEVNGKV
jgi:hypothetical protein